MVELPEGFIAHDGGPCPVERNIWIEPLFRREMEAWKGERREFGYAHQFAWQHDGEDDDIIAYKPHKGAAHG